ncbi:type I restriction enzyme, S subunit [Prevotella aff. ruminicola Tc2-24]|uniref:Type I restriction enzyme, S subunit n=1 Tax=Prevotella aff. ruminicola Tc2-24 TaxID=81582 RepID=A0A1I0PMY9_9BACT|nr:restriction endonuclease subunit S [Prevotella aff. ruminicola Tc2-24]SEW15726.1 type I restriction enzyme, S subunit [Prevotella aff. ruminicola Tc2-24]
MSWEMKHSGIEWIGEIPKEWKYSFLKYIYIFEKGKNAQQYTKDYIGIHPGVFPVYSGQTENEGVMGCIDTFDYDIDECLFTTTVGAKVMTPKILRGRFSLSQNCLIMKKKKLDINNTFFYFLLISLFDYQKSLIPSHMQPSLRIEDLNTYSFYLPSPSEQQKIANYLDKVCGEVDEMIALQEQMIEELKAYKQSVITEAVTKGLNPDVPMKDSGIDWIGEVPEHWNLHQFRRIFVIKKIIAGTLGYDVLSVTQNGIKVKDLTKNEGQIAQDYSKYQLVDVHDYVMNHMDLLTGYVDCSKQVGVTSPDYRVFRAIDKTQISLSYYLKIFQTCYKEKIFYHLGQGVSGMGRWRLPADQLKLFYLPMPPLSEQQSIASYLDTKCAEIDALIAIKQAKIEELKDYKKSVIYEYVTGKKEVI